MNIQIPLKATQYKDGSGNQSSEIKEDGFLNFFVVLAGIIFES